MYIFNENIIIIGNSCIKYNIVIPKKVLYTVYWLHGYNGNCFEFYENYDIKELSEKYSIAIVTPSVGNNYYIDKDNICISKIISKNLVDETRYKYDLPNKRENTFISGVSMGGYGALLIGSKYASVFGKIASISGSFIVDDILIGNPEVVGYNNCGFSYFSDIFGDLSELEFSYNKNPLCAAIKSLKEHKLPNVFLSCGKEDILFKRNEKINKKLIMEGANVKWYPHNGGHNWRDFAIDETFKWLSSNTHD